MKKISILLCLVVFFATCKKDVRVCTTYTQITSQKHLVDISPLKGAPQLIDTLNKYSNLQVYRVIIDDATLGMECHVFCKGLQVFTHDFSLLKIKNNVPLYASDSSFTDTINLSTTPAINYLEAISIAHKNENFSKTCISYQLGFYDINASSNRLIKNYKLVWLVKGENDAPYVYMDANSGQVYNKFDGMFY
jgi:hypothetical protein